MSPAEKTLRELWTGQGIPAARQDALIAGITAKAQPGAMVGPFRIPQTYAERVRELEQEGESTSDAQGIADAEKMKEPGRFAFDPEHPADNMTTRNK